MPRLAVLVLTGRVNLLRYLAASGRLDLETSFIICHNAGSGTAEEDTDCAVCLEPLRSPVSLPCTHRFCLACLHKWQRTSSQ
eukprot:2018944-Rhodomonas_salina.1